MFATATLKLIACWNKVVVLSIHKKEKSTTIRSKKFFSGTFLISPYGTIRTLLWLRKISTASDCIQVVVSNLS